MFAILAAAAFAATVDIEATGRASGGDRVVSPSTGVALTVPKGMTATLRDEAVFLEGPGGVGGMILVDPSLTIDGAIAATQQGLAIGDGVFVSVGNAQRTGSTATVVLKSTDGSYAGHGYATTAGPAPLSILLVAPKGTAINDAFNGLVASLGAVERPPASAPSSSGAWDDELRGIQLANYQNRDSMSTRTRVDLCTDGALYVYTGSSFHSGPGSVADVSGVTQGGASGSWSVQGSTLTLRWADGSSETRELSYGPNKELLVNDERWLRADLERCR